MHEISVFEKCLKNHGLDHGGLCTRRNSSIYTEYEGLQEELSILHRVVGQLGDRFSEILAEVFPPPEEVLVCLKVLAPSIVSLLNVMPHYHT